MMTTQRSNAANFLTPEKRNGALMWQQIANTLGTEIRNRNFSATGKLPGESELAERFGVKRHTLRQAVAALQVQGLVRVEPGRGTFVQNDLLNYPLSRRTRYGDNLRAQGLQPGKQLLTAMEIPAPEHVAAQLKIQSGAAVLMIQTLDEADDQPIGLATSYYPAARFNGLLERLGDGSQISAILRHFGVEDFVRAKSCITTQMPSEETARLLKQSVLRPLLCVENLDVDMNSVPVKYGETLFCGDRVQLAVTTGENS